MTIHKHKCQCIACAHHAHIASHTHTHTIHVCAHTYTKYWSINNYLHDLLTWRNDEKLCYILPQQFLSVNTTPLIHVNIMSTCITLTSILICVRSAQKHYIKLQEWVQLSQVRQFTLHSSSYCASEIIAKLYIGWFALKELWGIYIGSFAYWMKRSQCL